MVPDCVDGRFGVHCFVCVLLVDVSDCTDGRFGVHCFVCVLWLMFSDCVDGRFGVHCQSRCHCKDTSEVCDSVSGRCESGCRTNYAGDGCLLGKLWCNCTASPSYQGCVIHFPLCPSPRAHCVFRVMIKVQRVKSPTMRLLARMIL